MKFVSEENLQGHSTATIRGALEGTAAGLALSVPGSIALHRRWAYYRNLPLTIKALGVVLVVGPMFAIQAERRGVEYDKAHWTGAGKLELDREALTFKEHWNSLSPWDKAGDWAGRHKYQLLLGCWAMSMAGSWFLISRGNTTQTFAQKIVQARVYAQGITVTSVIGAAMLTHTQRRDALEEKRIDHSWAAMLEQQRLEDNALKAGASA